MRTEIINLGFDYKPFGDTLNADGEERLGYIGKERDEESRYVEMGVRFYDPDIGRFLSPDPFMDKFSFYSPYQYAFNNPVSFIDPTGYEPEKENLIENCELRIANWEYEQLRYFTFFHKTIINYQLLILN